MPAEVDGVEAEALDDARGERIDRAWGDEQLVTLEPGPQATGAQRGPSGATAMSNLAA